MQKNNIYKFNTSLRWNFYGCIIYEILAMLHHIALMRYMNTPLYAFIVSTLSLIPLGTKCTDFGFTATLTSYWLQITKNKRTFVFLLKKTVLIPMLLFFCITSAIMLIYMIQQPTIINWHIMLLVCGLIGIETSNNFLRKLLNFAWFTPAVVCGELIILTGYISIWWLFWLLYTSQSIMLYIIFIHKTLLLFYFLFLYYLFLKQLPHDTNTIDTIEPAPKKLFLRQLSTGSLRFSKELYAAPALSSFFAYSYGATPATLFYGAATLVSGISTLVKMIINYSGAALLANEKNKIPLFSKLSKLLSQGIFFFCIVLVCTIDLYLQKYHATSSFSMYLLLWFFIQLIDTATIVYEQYFIAQKASNLLILIRLCECIALAIISVFNKQSMLTFLFMLFFIKVLTLICTGYYTYNKLHTTWNYSINHKVIIIGTTIGISIRAITIHLPYVINKVIIIGTTIGISIRAITIHLPYVINMVKNIPFLDIFFT